MTGRRDTGPAHLLPLVSSATRLALAAPVLAPTQFNSLPASASLSARPFADRTMSLRRPRSLVLSLLVCVLLVGVCVSGYSTKTWEGSTTCDENAAHAYQQHQVNNNCVSSSALAGVNSVKVVCNTPKLTTSVREGGRRHPRPPASIEMSRILRCAHHDLPATALFPFLPCRRPTPTRTVRPYSRALIKWPGSAAQLALCWLCALTRLVAPPSGLWLTVWSSFFLRVAHFRHARRPAPGRTSSTATTHLPRARSRSARSRSSLPSRHSCSAWCNQRDNRRRTPLSRDALLDGSTRCPASRSALPPLIRGSSRVVGKTNLSLSTSSTSSCLDRESSHSYSCVSACLRVDTIQCLSTSSDRAHSLALGR